MKAKLTREMAVSVLSGDLPEAATEAAFHRGFVTLRDVRLALAGALKAGLQLSSSRGYVRVGLPRGATAELPLRGGNVQVNGNEALLAVQPANGHQRRYFTAADCARELARLCGTNVEAAVRVLLGIERARQQCYHLAEEGTRWL